MGNTLTVYGVRSSVEDFIDTLQGKGFSQLESKLYDSREIWNGADVYGSKSNRYQSFKQLLDYTVPLFKEGYKRVNQDPNDVTMDMEKYIIAQLANHVMKCLLSGNTSLPFVFNEIKAGLFLDYEIPQYEEEIIEKFKKTWTKLENGNTLSLASKDAANNEVLSATLGSEAFQVISAIDITKLVAESVTNFNAKKEEKEQNRNKLFAQKGDAKSLLASRKPYREEEQKAEFKKSMG